MRVGYLGPKGSFTYVATTSVFEKDDCYPYATIPSCLRAIEQGEIDYGVVPIENTIEGTVNPTLDYLYAKGNTPIQAELILPISQQLMIHPNWVDKWQDVELVQSHPQALAQSQQFLADFLPDAQQCVTTSTTAAANWVKEHPRDLVAAIGSELAAKEYQLTIVKRDIQDIEQNETRFWIIGKEKMIFNELVAIKTRQSLLVEMTNNQPGNLHKILGTFSWRGLDLTKVESRPLKTKLGDYFFLIDVKGDNSSLISMAMSEIESLGGIIKVLGNYDVFYC